MRIVWQSPAKINRFLFITGRLESGYHTLQTLIQLLNFGDKITILPRHDSKIVLTSSLATVPDEQNLALQAARLLADYVKQRGVKQPFGVDISIKKKIPLGAGLGGGSSNAATVLIAVNCLWGNICSKIELAMLGLRLGADVPFFIQGETAFVEGIGEKLQPIELEKKYFLIVYPGFSISTQRVFNHKKLPRNAPSRTLAQYLASPFTNVCEVLVRETYPMIVPFFVWLQQYSKPQLTGTGSALFAEFEDDKAAQQALATMPSSGKAFIADSINQSPIYFHCHHNKNRGDL